MRKTFQAHLKISRQMNREAPIARAAQRQLERLRPRAPVLRHAGGFMSDGPWRLISRPSWCWRPWRLELTRLCGALHSWVNSTRSRIRPAQLSLWAPARPMATRMPRLGLKKPLWIFHTRKSPNTTPWVSSAATPFGPRAKSF